MSFSRDNRRSSREITSRTVPSSSAIPAWGASRTDPLVTLRAG
jgi:hypothetical protein